MKNFRGPRGPLKSQGCLVFISLSDFAKCNTSSGCNECQRKVDCACGFDKDVREEFATIISSGGLLSLSHLIRKSVHHDDLEHHACKFNNVEEQGTLRFIVLLEQLRLSSTDYTFDSEEQTTNVDSIECGRKTENSLITEQDYALTGNATIGLMRAAYRRSHESW